jgi:hypothetical protein
MPELTTGDLARLARNADLELRVVNNHGEPQLEQREGWWGGRLMRNLKIYLSDDDRSGKRHEYMAAKREVLDALRRAYGDEIGERAFHAGIGRRRERDDRWETSRDTPITGRHIAKMLETAEREVRRTEPHVVQDFGNGLFVGGDTKLNSNAVRDWFRLGVTGEDSPDLEGWRAQRQRIERFDPKQPDKNLSFKISDVTIGDQHGRFTQGLGGASVVAENLLQDANTRRQETPGDHPDFWVLQIVGRDTPFDTGHPIGIRIDRDDPDIVHVFDPQRREVSVPKDQFAGWLSMHAKEVYGAVASFELRRVDQQLLGLYQPGGDGWTVDRDIPFDDDMVAKMMTPIIETIKNPVERGLFNLETGLARQFHADINRCPMAIEGSPPLRLTQSNYGELVRLVETGDEEGDLKAARNLSLLMNQTMFNGMSEQLRVALYKDGNIVGGGKDDFMGIYARRMIDDDNDAAIEIDIRGQEYLSWLNHDGEALQVNSRTNSLRYQCTIRVKLKDVQDDQWHDKFVFSEKPRAQLSMELPRDDMDAPNQPPRAPGDKFGNYDLRHMTFLNVGGQSIALLKDDIDQFSENWRNDMINGQLPGNEVDEETGFAQSFLQNVDENRMQIEVVYGDTNRVQLTKELVNQGTAQEAFASFVGFDDNAIAALSMLVDPVPFTGLVNTVRERFAEPPFDDLPPPRVTVRQREAGSLDIEFRYPLPPEDDGRMLVHHWDEPPEQPGPRDIAMSIRIPLEALQQGRPNAFTVWQQPYVEESAPG